MREIKFRAWDNAIKRYWWNVQNAYDTLSNHDTPNPEADSTNDFCESCFGYVLSSDRYVIEQFTGLRDTNGKEIYEGDILLCDPFCFSQELKAEVCWSSSGYWGCEFVGEEDGVLLHVLLNTVSMEVCGNIHENPELLK